MDVPVVNRHRLACGDKLEGPAIIEQDDATTWLLPDQRAIVDSDFNVQVQV